MQQKVSVKQPYHYCCFWHLPGLQYFEEDTFRSASLWPTPAPAPHHLRNVLRGAELCPHSSISSQPNPAPRIPSDCCWGKLTAMIHLPLIFLWFSILFFCFCILVFILSYTITFLFSNFFINILCVLCSLQLFSVVATILERNPELKFLRVLNLDQIFKDAFKMFLKVRPVDASVN